MGMSASQARLISLTARMSDVEYEGQQINQQRLTLANQMNAVYEALYNMDVPTAPSKIDYKHNVYTGKSKASDTGNESSYIVKNGPDGKLKAYIEQQGAVVKNSNTTASVSKAVEPKNYLTPVSNASEAYKPQDFREKIENASEKWDGFGDDDTMSATYTYYTQNGTYSEEEANNSNGEHKAGDPKYVSHEITYNNKKQNEIEADLILKADKNAPTPWSEPRNITYSGTRNLKENEPFQEGKTYIDGSGKEISGKEILEHNNTEFVVYDGKNSYETKTRSALSSSDYTRLYQIQDGQKENFNKAVDAVKNGSANGITVGGHATKTITEADTEYRNNKNASDAWEQAIQGLKNSFPEGVEDKASWKDFTVIVQEDNGKYSFSFCLTSDIELDSSGQGDGRTTIYRPGEGKYNKGIEDFDSSSAQYDGLGVKSVVIDGNIVTLGVESVFDEDAYDVAMQEYNNKKALYDEEQNRLNKQTSIYQRQDKQLELKLTRIDNERNSLNTEIEAVKKVIKDAVDRGFKTFSG